MQQSSEVSIVVKNGAGVAMAVVLRDAFKDSFALNISGPAVDDPPDEWISLGQRVFNAMKGTADVERLIKELLAPGNPASVQVIGLMAMYLAAIFRRRWFTEEILEQLSIRLVTLFRRKEANVRFRALACLIVLVDARRMPNPDQILRALRERLAVEDDPVVKEELDWMLSD